MQVQALQQRVPGPRLSHRNMKTPGRPEWKGTNCSGNAESPVLSMGT